MNKNKILFFSLFLVLFFSFNSCSDNNCFKEIIIQPELTITSPTGTAYIPKVTQEVPCDFPDIAEVKELTQLPKLTNFSYEIIDLTVIPDTGNNTSKVSYTIKLNNLSNENVIGYPYLTTRLNNDSMTASYPFTQGCSELKAQSSCTINFESESSLDYGYITAFSIENVEYLILQ